MKGQIWKKEKDNKTAYYRFAYTSMDIDQIISFYFFYDTANLLGFIKFVRFFFII